MKRNISYFYLISYTEKKETLGELLRQADTGSLDYKRFSFIIQLL